MTLTFSFDLDSVNFRWTGTPNTNLKGHLVQKSLSWHTRTRPIAVPGPLKLLI